jgi:hypothetical protein
MRSSSAAARRGVLVAYQLLKNLEFGFRVTLIDRRSEIDRGPLMTLAAFDRADANESDGTRKSRQVHLTGQAISGATD